MKSKIKYEGWWRARIRSRYGSNTQYHWIYFHASAPSKTLLFREARFMAGLYLRRQIFDVEQIHSKPDRLKIARVIDGMEFFYQDALAAVPQITAQVQGGAT
jgi:hypothetical protein